MALAAGEVHPSLKDGSERETHPSLKPREGEKTLQENIEKETEERTKRLTPKGGSGSPREPKGRPAEA